MIDNIVTFKIEPVENGYIIQFGGIHNGLVERTFVATDLTEVRCTVTEEVDKVLSDIIQKLEKREKK